MRKVYSRNIIKVIVFIGIVMLVGNRILPVLNYKDMGGGGGWQRYYNMDESSADVLFFGSSHAHCTIDHGYLWDTYGMAGFTLSAGSQSIDSTYYFVKEVLRTRNPKVLVVEMLGVTGNEMNNSNVEVYRNSLGMRWSHNLWDFANYFRDNMDMDNDWRNQIFAKIPVIHSRYAELTAEDFHDSIPFLRGYRGSFDKGDYERPTAENNEEILELNPERMEMLERIVKLTKEKEVPLVLFASPYLVTDEEQMNFNAVEAYAKSNGVPFINFNKLYDEIGLDFTSDFRDEHHVNNSGAAKVSAYLADFLKVQYQIPDRRGQEGYKLWEQNSLYLKNKQIRNNLEMAADINEYLIKILELKNKKTVILALTGNYTALGDVYLNSLMKLGITREEYNAGGAWVFEEGGYITRLSGKEYNRCFATINGEIHLESSIKSKGEENIEIVTMLINSREYQMVDNGVNVIVYDEALDQVIDAAGDDVYLGLEMVHKEYSEP